MYTERWYLVLWFELNDHKVVVSEDYAPSGPKMVQLQAALHFDIQELEKPWDLVSRSCRLLLRRNKGYPRYKVVEIVASDDPTEQRGKKVTTDV
jgi:hypothetical protein